VKVDLAWITAPHSIAEGLISHEVPLLDSSIAAQIEEQSRQVHQLTFELPAFEEAELVTSETDQAAHSNTSDDAQQSARAPPQSARPRSPARARVSLSHSDDDQLYRAPQRDR